MSYVRVTAEDKILAWAQEIKAEFSISDVHAEFQNSRNTIEDAVRALQKQGKLTSNNALKLKERKWRVV